LPDLFRDLHHTLRRLSKTPLFTLATVLTLALGIGANTAIFSVIHRVILKPLPFPDSDRLIGVWQTAPGVNIKDLNASVADYVTYREHSTTFEDVALWFGRAVTITEFADPERVDGIGVTFRLFPMLGVQPQLGRGFTEKDSESGSPDVMMISHRYWQRRFGGDPKVIGRRIQADGVAREIVGVLPDGLWFLDWRHDTVVPLRYDRATVRLAGYNFQAIAKLKPGITITQANADVARMIAIQLTKFPPPQGMSTKMMEDAKLGPNVRLLKDDLLGDIGKTLWVVMATIGIVLLIACANVANLLLVRMEGRSQELAVRAALGAGRLRLVRELLVESLALALAGGVAGIAIAIGVLRLILSLNTARLPRLEQVSLDATSILFTLALSIVAGLALGVIPVWRHGNVAVADALRAGGGRTVSAGRERNFARNSLTVVQVALALILLIGSALMIRTFLSMRQVQPGFHDPQTLQTMRVSIARTAATQDDEIRRLHQNLMNRLASLPGVTAVGLTGSLPMIGANSQDPIAASDKTYRPDQIPPLRRFITAAPGTFQALGVPLAAGREYSWTDILEKRQVVIISENFAREYWGSAQAAIGRQIRSNPRDEWSEIIGVAGDVRQDGVEKAAPTAVYWPLRGHNVVTYLVRTTRAGSESLSNELRQAVWSVNSSVPITDVRTMQSVYERSMSRTAFTMTLLGISGVMALLLAVIGIHAVIAYTVAQRRREIGIRMALGASQSSLKMLFVGHGLLWAGIGAAVGLAASAALSRLMAALLFEVNPVDPLTYAVVAVGILTAAAAASYLPARRISNVNPVEALRAE